MDYHCFEPAHTRSSATVIQGNFDGPSHQQDKQAAIVYHTAGVINLL